VTARLPAQKTSVRYETGIARSVYFKEQPTFLRE
jgi:hypothetical protein